MSFKMKQTREMVSPGTEIPVEVLREFIHDLPENAIIDIKQDRPDRIHTKMVFSVTLEV